MPLVSYWAAGKKVDDHGNLLDQRQMIHLNLIGCNVLFVEFTLETLQCRGLQWRIDIKLAKLIVYQILNTNNNLLPFTMFRLEQDIV